MNVFKSYFNLFRRLLRRRMIVVIIIIFYFFLRRYYYNPLDKSFPIVPAKTYNREETCSVCVSTDSFLEAYQPKIELGHQIDPTRAEPTVERIQTILQIVRDKESQYQSLLDRFDVFDMTKPMETIRNNEKKNSNVDEMKLLYNRYIRLSEDQRTVVVNKSFVDYLRKVSSYLSDGLRDQRTKKFEVQCHPKPTFVLASNQPFFDIMQGTLRSLDMYWPDHPIAVYDLGYSKEQRELLIKTCNRCTIIDFPYDSIESIAPHIRQLNRYAFKPFVIQDALRRYGLIIYGDASARFNENSFTPVIIDNYIRGFAARELPGHSLACYTRSGMFNWFNQSDKQYEDIYMAEANFLAVTDTFLTRLIMKAWLTCALDPACLIAKNTQTKCNDKTMHVHRFDQSAMVTILTHFFFQGTRSAWMTGKSNDPTPYDMFTSVQINLGDICRGSADTGYLESKLKG